MKFIIALTVIVFQAHAIAAPRPCYKQAKDAVLKACERENSDSDCYIDSFAQISLSDDSVTYSAYVNIVNMGFTWKSYHVTADYTRSSSGRYTCKNVKAE